MSHLPKPYPNENKALLGNRIRFCVDCLPSARIHLSFVDLNVSFALFRMSCLLKREGMKSAQDVNIFRLFVAVYIAVM